MFTTTGRLAATATALLLGLGGAAAIGGQSARSDGPVRCEIVTSTGGGMTMLESVVHADRRAGGTYDFRVASASGGGSSGISQGGEFFAEAGETVSLGRVSIGSGSAYDARLEISFGGERATCAARIGI